MKKMGTKCKRAQEKITRWPLPQRVSKVLILCNNRLILQLLFFLADGRCWTVKDMVEKLGESQGYVSECLQLMQERQWVEYYAYGKLHFYSLTEIARQEITTSFQKVIEKMSVPQFSQA